MDEQEILQHFLQEIKKYPVLPEEESNKLLYEYQVENNQESYEKLVLHNLGLLVLMAKKYIGKSKHMGVLDFIQENYFIMRNAISHFNPSKGYKLSTYICESLGRSLQTQIDKQDKTINIPVNIQKKERKYYEYIKHYYNENGIEPSEKQIQKEAKISIKDQMEIKKLYLYKPLSLNTEEMNEEIINKIEDDKNSIIDWENDKDALILLRSICDYLTRREYYIFYHQTIDYMTQIELGKRLEISSERVRQIYAQAGRKLRKIGLSKLQEHTSKLYDINNIDASELVPLDPKINISLYYLKSIVESLPYHIIYTKFCDRNNDNLSYYQNHFPEESFCNIESMMKKVRPLISSFLIPENIDKIYNNARKSLSVQEILELDIKPNALHKEFSILFKEQEERMGPLKELEKPQKTYLKK